MAGSSQADKPSQTVIHSWLNQMHYTSVIFDTEPVKPSEAGLGIVSLPRPLYFCNDFDNPMAMALNCVCKSIVTSP